VLQALQEKGKVLAVVTSRSQDSLFAYFRELKIYDYFTLFITPESTTKHKPDPEPLLAAISHLGAVPSDCIFIGDTRYDMECAHNAGITSCFVNWSESKADSLPVTPAFCIDTMHELL